MHIVIFITAGKREEAKHIAEDLVEGGYAACVNIIDGVTSIFRWQGKIEEAKEYLLVIKSLESRLDDITRRVKQLHSYAVPEIIAFRVIGGSKDYLEWITSSVERNDRGNNNGKKSIKGV
jgi:periplasmic divalent cation tolerance protein